MRGFFSVAIGLIALQVFSSSNLPGLGKALSYPATLVAKWIDPTVPLLAGGKGTPAGSTVPLTQPAGFPNVASAALAGVNAGITNLSGAQGVTLPPGTTARAPA